MNTKDCGQKKKNTPKSPSSWPQNKTPKTPNSSQCGAKSTGSPSSTNSLTPYPTTSITKPSPSPRPDPPKDPTSPNIPSSKTKSPPSTSPAPPKISPTTPNGLKRSKTSKAYPTRGYRPPTSTATGTKTQPTATACKEVSKSPQRRSQKHTSPANIPMQKTQARQKTDHAKNH